MSPGSFPVAPETRSFVPRRTIGRPADPVAAIIGNASLLGIGYVLMGRPRLAAAGLTGTAVFMLVLAADPDSVTWRALLAGWWLATILHTWWLTRGAGDARPLLDPDDTSPARRPRLFAVGAAGLVLIAVVGLRVDAWLIVRDAAHAHADGDCARAVALLERLDATHRIAYGSMAAAGEQDLEACRLLLVALDQEPGTAAVTLQAYLDHPEAGWEGAGPKRAEVLLAVARGGGSGTESNLKAAFTQLTTTLEVAPSQSGRVEEVVETFLADLADDPSPCEVKRINDWIYAQDWGTPELAAPIVAASDQVPDRMLQCAREQSEAGMLEAARTGYERFRSEFPDHAQAGQAADEQYAVETTIERGHVEELLSANEYCDDPAPYRGAEAYRGKGPHAMRMFGLSPDSHDFPDSWTADNVDDTVLVVCVAGPERGGYQDSCYYEADLAPLGATEVDFYASRFDIKAYELKTGELVADYTQEIGDPCPEILYYETLAGLEFDIPPSEVESDYTSSDVRSMFDRLMD